MITVIPFRQPNRVIHRAFQDPSPDEILNGSPAEAVGTTGQLHEQLPMRLWTLHPKYLDSKGLVALWREGLLAQAVLSGETKGYKRHPQLLRFLQTPEPTRYLSAYLSAVFAEAAHRGFHFDHDKICQNAPVPPLTVTKGQLEYEWLHLTRKLETRAPAWLAQISKVDLPEPHPLFRVIEGGIAPWEVVQA